MSVPCSLPPKVDGLLLQLIGMGTTVLLARDQGYSTLGLPWCSTFGPYLVIQYDGFPTLKAHNSGTRSTQHSSWNHSASAHLEGGELATHQ